MSDPLTLNRMERGRDLTDAEISDYLANRQTVIRHGTADIGTEIAEKLRDRLAAYPGDWTGWTPPWVAARSASPVDRAGLDNAWLDRLIKAERENHCGDAACMTRRVSAAIRVLTGGKEHQDYCWAIEAFEAELGVRDPALVGPEPSNATLDAALGASPVDREDELDRAHEAWHGPTCSGDCEVMRFLRAARSKDPSDAR